MEQVHQVTDGKRVKERGRRENESSVEVGLGGKMTPKTAGFPGDGSLILALGGQPSECLVLRRTRAPT